MLFSLKNPTIQITTYVIQLVSYPIGLGWDLVFPDRQFSIAGVKFNFKPGKFNFKEHVVIVVMSNVSTNSTRAESGGIQVALILTCDNRQPTGVASCMLQTS